MNRDSVLIVGGGFSGTLLAINLTRLGVPVLSQAPSVQSVYGAVSPRLGEAALLAISQSGRRPDLL